MFIISFSFVEKWMRMDMSVDLEEKEEKGLDMVE